MLYICVGFNTEMTFEISRLCPRQCKTLQPWHSLPAVYIYTGLFAPLLFVIIKLSTPSCIDACPLKSNTRKMLCSLKLLQQYFSANEQCFSLAINQHKPNLSETPYSSKTPVSDCWFLIGQARMHDFLGESSIHRRLMRVKLPMLNQWLVYILR